MTPWCCVRFLILMIGVVVNLHAVPAIQNSNTVNDFGDNESKNLSPAEEISTHADEVSSPVNEAAKREAIKSVADETGKEAVKAGENVSKGIKDAGEAVDNVALDAVQGLNKALTGLVTTKSPKRAINKEDVEIITIAATSNIESSNPVNEVAKREASTSTDKEWNDAMNSREKAAKDVKEISMVAAATNKAIEAVKELEEKLEGVFSHPAKRDSNATEGAAKAIGAPAIQNSKSVDDLEAPNSSATASKARNGAQKSKSLKQSGIAAASKAKETVKELEDELKERLLASDKHGKVAVTKQAAAVVAPAMENKDLKHETHTPIKERIEGDAKEVTKRIKKAGHTVDKDLQQLVKELSVVLKRIFEISDKENPNGNLTAVDADSDEDRKFHMGNLAHLVALEGMVKTIQSKAGNNTVKGDDIENYLKESAQSAQEAVKGIDNTVKGTPASPAKRDAIAMEADAESESAFASLAEEEEALAKVANATAEIMNKINEVVAHLSTPLIPTE